MLRSRTLSAILVSSIASTTFAAPPPDLSVIPDSACVQLKEVSMKPADLDQVKELGVKWVRRGFLWQNVEKTAGVYDFSHYDQFVKDCNARGLHVLATLGLQNDKLYGLVYEDKGREAYAKYAAAVVEHFKGQGILWEIWNEPNVQTFWTKHGQGHNSEQYAEEYLALVKAAVPGMRKADPDCVILGGAVSGLWTESYKWMDFAMQKGILKSGIDVWSVHPYSTKNPEDFVTAYAKTRELMQKNGGPSDIPMMDSERGFPIGKAEGAAGGDASKQFEYQAWHFVRQYCIDRMSGVQLTNWYEWSGKEGFSLIAGPDKKNPAYNAAKFMIDQLTGYHYDSRVETANDRDFVLKFKNAAGAEQLVAWTSPPADGTPDQTVNHDVQIPVTATSSLDTFAIYGDKTTTDVKAGELTISLTGSPQYVVLKAK